MPWIPGHCDKYFSQFSQILEKISQENIQQVVQSNNKKRNLEKKKHRTHIRLVVDTGGADDAMKILKHQELDMQGHLFPVSTLTFTNIRIFLKKEA